MWTQEVHFVHMCHGMKGNRSRHRCLALWEDDGGDEHEKNGTQLRAKGQKGSQEEKMKMDVRKKATFTGEPAQQEARGSTD